MWGHEALPRDPRELIADGSGADVALLTGTNEDEMALWGVTSMSANGLDSMLAKLTGDPAGMEATYRRRLDGVDPGWLACAIGTDQVFRIPAVRLADARHANGADTWMYRFLLGLPGLRRPVRCRPRAGDPLRLQHDRPPGCGRLPGSRRYAHRPGRDHPRCLDRLHPGPATRPRPPSANGPPTTRSAGRVMDLDDECGLVDDPEADERRLWSDLVT